MNSFLQERFRIIRFTGPVWARGIFILLMPAIVSCMNKNDNLDAELEDLLARSVPLIHPSELHKQLGSGKYVLLDIRTSEENAVSTIPGAVFYSYDDFDPADLTNIRKEDTVVVFCSVGYRSEKAGEKLLAAGYPHVKNLYGGIFGWKNEGFEVVDQRGRMTDSVHTYNENWSRYLKNGIKVYD